MPQMASAQHEVHSYRLPFSVGIYCPNCHALLPSHRQAEGQRQDLLLYLQVEIHLC